MGQIFEPYDPDQASLFPPSPTDWLPQGHLAYFVSETVEELDLSDFIAKYVDRDIDFRVQVRHGFDDEIWEPTALQVLQNIRNRSTMRIILLHFGQLLGQGIDRQLVSTRIEFHVVLDAAKQQILLVEPETLGVSIPGRAFHDRAKSAVDGPWLGDRP